MTDLEKARAELKAANKAAAKMFAQALELREDADRLEEDGNALITEAWDKLKGVEARAARGEPIPMEVAR